MKMWLVAEDRRPPVVFVDEASANAYRDDGIRSKRELMEICGFTLDEAAERRKTVVAPIEFDLRADPLGILMCD